MPPELLRVDLQSTALKIKALRIANSTAAVFSQAPEPPPPFNVNQALRELRALGAFDQNENLTPLGRVLADLPVDPWVGKMVLEGAIFGCLDPILTVAGAMEIGRGIYAIHPDDKQRARQHILTNFAAGTESDQLTMLVAFRQWKRAGSSREFASNNFLHGTSLLNIDRAKQQLLRVLEDGGFLRRRRVASMGSSEFLGRGDWTMEDQMGGPEANTHSSDMAMVRAILCGALFPNVAEVTAKDEYRSSTDYKLRLTGGSVNSWRGLLGASGADGISVQSAAQQQNQQQTQPSNNASSGYGAGNSRGPADLLDFVDDDPEDPSGTLDLLGAPLPPRLLCYQDKQRVDGLLYLRSTTRADPLALLLLAPSEGDSSYNSNYNSSNPSLAVTSSLPWTRLEGQPAAVLAGWIRIQVQDEQRARIIDETRSWLARYLDWAIWRHASKRSRGNGGGGGGYGNDGYRRLERASSDDLAGEQEQDRLGQVLLREIVGVIGVTD
jgi:hypothetical protein